MNIDRSRVSKLILAKHLYNLSETLCLSANSYAASSGAILLQDALELAFLAVNLEGNKSNQFNDLLNNAEKVVGEFENKTQLEALNKTRVSIKHYGIIQDINEVQSFRFETKKALEQIASQAFKISFLEVSLLELINDGESKNFLKEAQKFIESEQYYEALIAIRKALFIEFEQEYDVSHLLKLIDTQGFELYRMATKASFNSTSKESLNENIRTPFDLIAINWDRIRQDLLKLGIPIQQYENIYHLTPTVIRLRESAQWNIYDEKKYKEKANRLDAIYCLDKLIEMLLQKQKMAEMERIEPWIPHQDIIANNDINIYETTSKESEPTNILKKGTSYFIKASFIGLDGNEYYEIKHNTFWLNQFIRINEVQ